jgi:hypothetical protein
MFLPCLLIARLVNPVSWYDFKGSYRWPIFCSDILGQIVRHRAWPLDQCLAIEYFEEKKMIWNFKFWSAKIFSHEHVFPRLSNQHFPNSRQNGILL